jgi:dTDP-4-amino-4,6-dideoxygalactose transaminase
MDSFQAAILKIKLLKLDEWNAARVQQAQKYSELLTGLPIALPRHYQDSDPVWHCYVIEHEQRDSLRSQLLEIGIETGIHYPVPIHLQHAYSSLGYRAGDFPVTEAFSRRCLSLPIYPELSDTQIQKIATVLHEVV